MTANDMHFRRQPNGSWAFDSPVTGTTHFAYRNEAGFAGRDWYVTVRNDDDTEKFLADDFGSRKEIVAWVIKHETDLLAIIERWG